MAGKQEAGPSAVPPRGPTRFGLASLRPRRRTRRIRRPRDSQGQSRRRPKSSSGRAGKTSSPSRVGYQAPSEVIETWVTSRKEPTKPARAAVERVRCVLRLASGTPIRCNRRAADDGSARSHKAGSRPLNPQSLDSALTTSAKHIGSSSNVKVSGHSLIFQWHARSFTDSYDSGRFSKCKSLALRARARPLLRSSANTAPSLS